MKLIDIAGKEENPENLFNFSNLAIFPGSFNPLHTGHRKIFEMLTEEEYQVVFEISKTRFQKQPYTDLQLVDLTSQFRTFAPLLITDAPLFIQKQALLEQFNPFWVMGYDTAKRWIEENRKLGGEEQQRVNRMKVIFIGRLSEGVYHDPYNLLDGSEQYQYTIFPLHCDISSTQIRENRSRNQQSE